jgi:hypothetical protein
MNTYLSFWNRVRHRNDHILHVGFDYRGKILQKTLSNVFFLEAKREVLIESMDNVLSWMIDHIKMIKKTFNWTLPKYYRDFN